MCDAFSDYLFNIHIIIVNLTQVKLLIKNFVNYYYNINGTTSLKTVFIYKKKSFLLEKILKEQGEKEIWILYLYVTEIYVKIFTYTSNWKINK